MSFSSAHTARRIRGAARLFAPRVAELAAQIAHIPAPTFHEERRAIAVAHKLAQSVSVKSVARDELNNVTARISGRKTDRQTLIAAHLDTVFPLSTPLNIRREAGRLSGPGVGDNAVAVAAMIYLPTILKATGTEPATDLILAATVGEEGFGNLRGIRNVLNNHPATRAVIAIEGHHLGRMTYQAVGSRRYVVRFVGPGGHSFGHFGRASAIHALGSFITKVTSLPLNEATRTTINVGTVEGGTSVSTIAADAALSLDIRSVDQRCLDDVTQRVLDIGDQESKGGITVSFDLIGERPAASNPPNSPIARRVSDTMTLLGITPVLDISSTDVNLPLSRGIPSVCIGMTYGDNAHRLDEYIEVPPIATGLAQLALVVLSISEGVARGEIAPYGTDSVQPSPVPRQHTTI